jgi:hypothetical protein
MVNIRRGVYAERFALILILGLLNLGVLAADDVAIGPLLRYDLRESGIGTTFTRDYHTGVVAFMADVYGEDIRMRWVVGAGLYRVDYWSAASTRIPEHSWKDDDIGLVLENHMALGREVVGYSHVVAAQFYGEGLSFRFAPSLEFPLCDRLTLGPLLDGSFFAGDGAATSSEVGLAVRWYIHPSVFVTVTPRYPILIFDDHQLEGIFWSGAVGWRM